MSDAVSEDFIMPFGKYRGQTLGDILAGDPKYLDWLAGLDNLRAPLRAAVDDMVEKYGAEIDRAMVE